MQIKIHDFQISILRELLFKPGARFRDLKKIGLVIKSNGRYTLSDTGKEFANRIDTDALKLERQGKITVALHPVRFRNGQMEYLVHKRLKEPFYGWHGTQSGKVRWDETPLECAKRELLGENIWMSGEQYKKLKQVFASFEVMDDVLKSKNLRYIERVEIVEEY